MFLCHFKNIFSYWTSYHKRTELSRGSENNYHLPKNNTARSFRAFGFAVLHKTEGESSVSFFCAKVLKVHSNPSRIFAAGKVYIHISKAQHRTVQHFGRRTESRAVPNTMRRKVQMIQNVHLGRTPKRKGAFSADEKLKVSPAAARAIPRVLRDNIEQQRKRGRNRGRSSRNNDRRERGARERQRAVRAALGHATMMWKGCR